MEDERYTRQKRIVVNQNRLRTPAKNPEQKYSKREGAIAGGQELKILEAGTAGCFIVDVWVAKGFGRDARLGWVSVSSVARLRPETQLRSPT